MLWEIALPESLKYIGFGADFCSSLLPDVVLPEHLEGNIMGWGWPKIEISEMTDSKLGAMCCFKAADGMIMGEGTVPQVINVLRFGEEEIN